MSITKVGETQHRASPLLQKLGGAGPDTGVTSHPLPEREKLYYKVLRVEFWELWLFQ